MLPWMTMFGLTFALVVIRVWAVKSGGSLIGKRFKIRFFRTPLKSFLATSIMSDKCWRKCGFVGDQTHMQNLLKVSISLDSQTFLLDIFPDNLSQDQAFLPHLLLMTERKMITICWLNPEPPTVTQWTQKIRQVYLMERLTAQLQLKTPVFERRWGPVIDFLK